MKIEKLSENKLKITLDVNDLKNKNIDIKSFIANSPESQDLFWDVMQEAEKEFGFTIDESMVYIEAHVSSAGNFVLTITKSAVNGKPTIRQRAQGTSVKLKRKEFPLSLDNSIFEFNSFKDFREYCKLANQDSFENVLLYTYNKKLFLCAEKCSDKLVLEYSSRIYDTKFMMSELQEYGKILYKDASLNKIIDVAHS